MENRKRESKTRRAHPLLEPDQTIDGLGFFFYLFHDKQYAGLFGLARLCLVSNFESPTYKMTAHENKISRTSSRRLFTKRV